MSIKTISYADLLEHVIWAFDLYEPYNRNERLAEKLSFESKQDLFVEQLKSRIIEGFCLHDHNGLPSEEGQNIISGLLDFSEAAASFVFSKVLIVPFEKDRIHKNYLKYIFCPILANYIIIFRLYSDVIPSALHLDNLLKTAQNDDISSAVRKILIEIIDKPECESYRDDMIDFIREIRPGRTQRRTTILQKISIARKTCKDFLEHESKTKNETLTEEYKTKHLNPLNELQDAYLICRAMLYFEMKTGLWTYLSRQYQKYDATFIDDARIESFAGDILFSIKCKNMNGCALDSRTRKHIEKLWIRASKDMPPIKDVRIKKIIESLYYLLGDITQKNCPFTDSSKIDKLIQEIISNEKKWHLHPYVKTLQAIYLIQDNKLNEAKNLLEESLEKITKDSVGNISYYASTLLVGLKIKTSPKQIKNGNINPQIQNIINTQPLYTHMLLADGILLSMNFDSIISDHYSHTILRSIKKYNQIIHKRLTSTESDLEPEQIIIDALDGVEAALQKFNITQDDFHQEDSESIIQNTLSEADKKAILITYLPKSTLYNCIRELRGLSSYLELSPDRHPLIYSTIDNNSIRKRLLKTIDPLQYELDTKEFTHPMVANVATNSNISELLLDINV